MKNADVATSTTTDGAYSIVLPPNSSVLVFSFVGYESEVTVSGSGNLTTIDVTMKVQYTNLNEVVVTGYTAQKKKNLQVQCLLLKLGI